MRLSYKNAEVPDFAARLESMKIRCQDMILEAIAQVKQRLPDNKKMFHGLCGFAPSRILSQHNRVPFSELPFKHLIKDKEDLIDNQYRKILLHIWEEEEVFKDGMPREAVPFWKGILEHQDSTMEHPYKDLALYALACLSTPISNATVERVFSQVALLKTKTRNRMKLPLLEALIRINLHLKLDGKCCTDFTVTESMLEKFNSSMYNESTEEEEQEELSVFDQ